MKRPKLEELTLREKIGQLLMLKQGNTIYNRINGELVYKSDEDISKQLQDRPFGSLWSEFYMYDGNITISDNATGATAAEGKKLAKKVTDKIRIPMLVGIDCENGTGDVYADGNSICSAPAIAAADDTDLTFRLNESIAREIKAGGGNWRWSPIVDIVNRYLGVSSCRTYSDNPDIVIKHAIAAVKGTESAGVASTIKHFPGCDPYEIRDAHIVPTKINISLDEWRATQGRTFKEVIAAGVDTVMVAHSAFPAADDTKINNRYLPATLSPKIINGLLREELGFDGVAITDGIAMAGLTTYAPYEEILVMAINAGNDILLGVPAEDFDIVYNAVIDGKIPMARIDESAERVLKLKEKLGLFESSEEEIDMQEQAPITAELDRQIAEKSITLIRDYNNNMLPLDSEKIKKVTIVWSSHYEEIEKHLEVMKQEFEKRGATVELRDGIASRQEMKKVSEEADLIVFAAYIGPHRPIGMPSLYGKKMETYISAFTYGKEKSVGVSMGYPYMHIDFMEGADTFFNIYSYSPRSQTAFVKALYGETKPTTVSPIDTEPKLRYVFG